MGIVLPPPDVRCLCTTDQVLTRAIDRVRFATEASPYRLVSKVVVNAGKRGRN